MFRHPSPGLENPVRLEVRSLRGIDLSGTNLEGARLGSCDLSGADLSSANLHGARAGVAWQRMFFAGLAALIGYQLGVLVGEQTGLAAAAFWGALLGFELFWAGSLDDPLPERLYPPGDERREQPPQSAIRSMRVARTPLVLAAMALVQVALVVAPGTGWPTLDTPVGPLGTGLLAAVAAGGTALGLLLFAYSRCLLLASRFQGASFADSDLGEASFVRIDLRDAVLCRANLVEADLRGADLRGADLEMADLRGANLEGANLDETSFHRAWMPDGRLFTGNLQDHALSPEELPE